MKIQFSFDSVEDLRQGLVDLADALPYFATRYGSPTLAITPADGHAVTINTAAPPPAPAPLDGVTDEAVAEALVAAGESPAPASNVKPVTIEELQELLKSLPKEKAAAAAKSWLAKVGKSRLGECTPKQLGEFALSLALVG